MFDAIEAQRKIASAYDLAFEQENLGPTVTVNGEEDMDSVTSAILDVINEGLKA